MKASKKPAAQRRLQGASFGTILTVILCVAILVLLVVYKINRLNVKPAPAPASPAAGGAQTPDAEQKTAGPAGNSASLTQVELDKATAATVQLQAQIDMAKADQADLQAQLGQSRKASADLQSRIDAANAEAGDLRAQLAKALAEAGGLKSQLAGAETDKSRLAGQLEQAKSVSADLQAKLQKSEGYITDVHPLLVRARHLPVRTSLEKVHGSPFELVNGRSSFTLHINNLFLEPLEVDLTIVHGDRTLSQSNTIGGGATLDLEKLAPGDKVTIGGDRYDPVKVAVP
jgi:chaperonin cofactor prefoldin